jgi:hypothetical protein
MTNVTTLAAVAPKTSLEAQSEAGRQPSDKVAAVRAILNGVTRSKLLRWICLVVAFVGLSASSTSHSAIADATGWTAHSPIRWIAVRRLAHGTLPGKQTYTIVGERYRFQRRVYFTLAVSIDRPGLPPGGGGGGSFNPSQTPGVFVYTALGACAPHPYAVVFGLLRSPRDKVVARRGARRTVLHQVPIPPVLHAHGMLAYARLGGSPSEVIVRRPDGTRLLDDKLAGGRCSPGMVIIAGTQASRQAR